MEPKPYQEQAVKILARYAQALQNAYELQDEQNKILAKANTPPLNRDDRIPIEAWKNIGKEKKYLERFAASKASIPHVCMEIPTGGGKTLLGVAALQHLIPSKTKSVPRFVLWVVPSNAIYEQTLKAFRTRAHPYRRRLDWITGKKLKLFEKHNPITQNDLDSHVCLMMLKFPAVNRVKNKDFLKIYRDSGAYRSLFPDPQNTLAQKHLLQKYPDLEKDGKRVRRSLFNALKIIRPIIVLDEAHKAYKEKQEQNEEFVSALNQLNPRFVLELSATPKPVSNILIKIYGEELDREQMIKMPIEIHNQTKNDWKQTLASAHEKQQELETNTRNLEGNTKRHIHPIVLVRVEHTGKAQLEKNSVHAEKVKQHLIEQLHVHESTIRIQSSEKHELKGENLMHPCNQVRWIITRDALKEGWDCAFAYILVLLDNTKASRAVTQMVGRVLRQPNAQKIEEDETLNRCYIYCNRWEVAETLKVVRQGLKDEGLSNIKDTVVIAQDQSKTTQNKKIVTRREEYEDEEIFLPRVLHKDEEKKSKWRPLNYERDILAEVTWHDIDIDENFSIRKPPNEEEDIREVNVQGEDKKIEGRPLLPASKLQLSYFANSLRSIVPNPWQTARIANNLIDRLKAQGYDETTLAYRQKDLTSSVETELTKKITDNAKKIFEQKVYNNDISFHLKTNKKLNYEMKKLFEFFLAPDEDDVLVNEKHDLPQKNLFKPIFKHHFNGMEKDFALYLDSHETLEWWHRVAVKQDYSLQGWRKDLVYPDFVAVRKDDRIFIFETKGLHLEGNDDTNYKQTLLTALEEVSRCAVPCGEIKTPSVTLRMLLSDRWENETNKALAS